MNPYQAEANAAVLTVRFAAVKAGWSQWILLSSDRHHDNIHCDRALERYHLEQAIERQALILDFGDLFCAMQGKYDPRSSKDDLRPEDKGDNYLDLIAEHAGKDFAPYAANWLLLGKLLLGFLCEQIVQAGLHRCVAIINALYPKVLLFLAHQFFIYAIFTRKQKPPGLPGGSLRTSC